jgi:acyl carrier protein
MDVLGVAQLGAEEDFFQLGGHSLLAAQMLGRVDQAFGISLPIAAVFRAPTVRHMAAMLRERPGTARAGKGRPAQPEGWRGGLSWLHRTGVRSLGARLGRVPVRAPPE